MVCGLVDVEFLKLAKGLHKVENPLDQFYNCNINLATGSGAINVFRPEASIKIDSKLAALPNYTTWDKIDIEGEITLKALVERLESQYGATVRALYRDGAVNCCIFDKTHIAKLSWKIELAEDGQLVIEPDEVFSAWPQLRTAAQMLPKLPVGGGARTNFEKQVHTAIASLAKVKESFVKTFDGPVSEAYIKAARPGDDAAEEQKYFDAVFEKRRYIALRAHVASASGEDADLPVIRYTFRK